MRVLIVEDKVKMAGLLRRAMRGEGLSADVAVRGEDALWMAASSRYDALARRTLTRIGTVSFGRAACPQRWLLADRVGRVGCCRRSAYRARDIRPRLSGVLAQAQGFGRERRVVRQE